MKKTMILMALVIMLSMTAMVSAVECDSTLSVVPCDVTSDLTLTSDVNINATGISNIINFTGDYTLDGAGYTISVDFGIESGNLFYSFGGDILIKNVIINSTNDNSGRIFFPLGGSAVFDNVNLNGESGAVNFYSNDNELIMNNSYAKNVLFRWYSYKNSTILNSNFVDSNIEIDVQSLDEQFYFENSNFTGTNFDHSFYFGDANVVLNNTNVNLMYDFDAYYGQGHIITIVGENVKLEYPEKTYDTNSQWDGSDATFTETFQFGTNWIFVNLSSSSLNDDVFNDTANITFSNLPSAGSSYTVKQDGVAQTEGVDYNLIFNDSSSLIIEVPSFSNWSIELSGGNTAPYNVNSTISPSFPQNSNDLLGYCSASDLDGDRLEFYYEWWNGTSQYETGYVMEGSYSLDNISSVSHTSGSWASLDEYSNGSFGISKAGSNDFPNVAICDDNLTSCINYVVDNERDISYGSGLFITDNDTVYMSYQGHNPYVGTSTHGNYISICDSEISNCTTELIENTAYISQWSDVIVLSSGKVVTVYQDSSDNGKVAICDSNAQNCDNTTFESQENGLSRIEEGLIELQDGRFAIGYGYDDYTSDKGRVVICDENLTCDKHTVTGTIDDGFVTITQLRNESIFVAYQLSSDNNIYVASCDDNASNCVQKQITSGGDTYRYPNIESLQDDRIALFYEDVTNGVKVFDLCDSEFSSCVSTNLSTSSPEDVIKTAEGEFAFTSSTLLFVTNDLYDIYEAGQEYLVNTLDSQYTEVDESWKFTCTAFDGTSNSTAVNSTSVTIEQDICDSSLSVTPCVQDGDFVFVSGDIIVDFGNINGTIDSGDISVGDDWVYVNSSSDLNVPAQINISNLPYTADNYGIFKDGSYLSASLSVSNRVNDGNNLSFNVTGFSNYSVYPLCDSSLSVSPCRIVDDMRITVGSVSNKDVYIITEENSNTKLFVADGQTFSDSNVTLIDKNSDNSAMYLGFETNAKVDNVTYNIEEANNTIYIRSLRGNFRVNNPDNLSVHGSISRTGSAYSYYTTTGSIDYDGVYKQGIGDMILYSGDYNLDIEPTTVILGNDYIWLNDSLTLGYHSTSNQYNKPNLQYVKSDMGYPDTVTDFKVYRNGVELTEGVEYQKLTGINSLYAPEESFLIEPLVDVTGNWSIDPNYAPVMNNVRIAPTEPSIAQDLNGYCNASDQEGGNLTYYYRWYNGSTLKYEGNNTDNPEGTEVLVATLDSGNTTDLDTWTFSCKANDGSIETDWVNDSVSIVGSPIIHNVEINPTVVSEFSGAVATCNATDSNNATFYYYHDWYLNGSLIESNTTLQGGVLTDTYDGSLSEGDIIEFSCFAGDGQYNVTNEVNVTKTVVYNTVPIINSSYIAPTNDTGVLNAYCTSYDANEDDLTFNYILYRNDIEFSSDLIVGGESGVQKLVESIDDDTNNSYLVAGDNWTLSCQADDFYNTSEYVNSSTIIITKDQVAPVVNDVKMYPLILLNGSEDISVTSNASDRNFDNLNYTFVLYESPSSVQSIEVDNFTDGLVYSGIQYPGSSSIIRTNVEKPLWTYSVQPSSRYATTINENDGQLIFSTRLGSPISYSLDGALAQQNYEIKTNNVRHIEFDYYLEHKSGGEKSYIRIGATTLKRWYNPVYEYQQESGHIDIYYNSTTDIVDLYINGVLNNSINISTQENNYLKFYWDEGRTFYPNTYRISNLNATKLLPTGYSDVESLISESDESIEVSNNFTHVINGSNFYKVGVTANDGTDDSTEVFSYEFLARDVNTPPTSIATTNPEVFVGVDDNIEGYCLAQDPEYDTVEYLWKWYVNDVVVDSGNLTTDDYFKYLSGESNLVSTLDSNYTDAGDTVVFSCAGYDSFDIGDYSNVSQYIWTDNNFAPSNPTIEFDSDYNGTESNEYPSNATFLFSITSEDVDGDDIKYEYRFVKNDAYQTLSVSEFVSSGESITLNLSSEDTTAGDEWYVRARATDGLSYSSWATSNTIIIENTLPILTTVEILGSITENSTLESNIVSSDEDEDSLAIEYDWYRNGVSFSNDSTFPFNYTQSGDNIILSARVYDGTNYTEWMNSSEIIITDSSNVAVLESVTIESNGGLVGHCLVNDEDGDDIDFEYIWYKNGLEFSNGSDANEPQGVSFTNSLVGTITEGDEYIFSCSANDSDGSIDYVNSSIFTIPEISFNYVVANKDVDFIKIDWTTNADEVYVYKDDVLISVNTLISYTLEGLYPNTQYNIKLIPYKDGYFGDTREFNETTEETDNNAPYMQDVFITPSTPYTDDALTGTCNANDVENANIFYTYTWTVNGVSVDSGVTSLTERNQNKVIGSITSSNYEAGDNVSLSCTANDGFASSNTSTYNLTVLNSEPVVDVVIIEISESNYQCVNSYSDIDGDNQTNPEYVWYQNGLETNYTNENVSVSNFNSDDELICQVTTGDGNYNITKNTSIFIVGDFVSPEISDVSIPDSVYTDSSYSISAVCEDNNNIATGYPRLRFVNPNYEEKEYQLYYDGDDVYQRYITFSVAGTYTNFEVECKDGNSNQDIFEYENDLISLVRETVINIGGGASSGSGEPEEEPEEFRNITSFSVNPTDISVGLSPGSTNIVEFEVVNKDIIDIDFTTAILVTEDSETFDWMEFEGGLKAITFPIEQQGGLSTNNRFVRYYINVPEDTPEGEYLGQIEVNGLEQTITHNVIIDVREGTFNNLFGWLDYEVLEIPFTQSLTGSAIADPDNIQEEEEELEGLPLKVWHILLTLIGGGISVFAYRRYLI